MHPLSGNRGALWAGATSRKHGLYCRRINQRLWSLGHVDQGICTSRILARHIFQLQEAPIPLLVQDSFSNIWENHIIPDFSQSNPSPLLRRNIANMRSLSLLPAFLSTAAAVLSDSSGPSPNTPIASVTLTITDAAAAKSPPNVCFHYLSHPSDLSVTFLSQRHLEQTLNVPPSAARAFFLSCVQHREK